MLTKIESLVIYLFTINAKKRNCHFFDKITRAKQDPLACNVCL